LLTRLNSTNYISNLPVHNSASKVSQNKEEGLISMAQESEEKRRKEDETSIDHLLAHLNEPNHVDKALQPIVNKVISGNRTLSVTILIDDTSPGNSTADTTNRTENIQESGNLKKNYSAVKIKLPETEINLPAFPVRESRNEDGILSIYTTTFLSKAFEEAIENLESFTESPASFYSSKEDGKKITCFTYQVMVKSDSILFCCLQLET
jgi:hypothetical protein